MNQLAQGRKSHPLTICKQRMEDKLVLETSRLLQSNIVHSEMCDKVVHHVRSYGLPVVTTTIRARVVECPLRDMRLSGPSREACPRFSGTTRKQRNRHCAWIHQPGIKRCSDDRRDYISTRAPGTQKGRPSLIFAILTREN
jgi:hypothetical protein